MKTVLIADDDPAVRTVTIETLEAADFSVYGAEDGDVAIRMLEARAFDVLVLDIIMPHREGLETLLEVRRRWPGLPVLAISGGGRLSPMDFLELARDFGADAVMSKPFGLAALTEVVQRLAAAPRSAPDAAPRAAS